MFTAPLIKIICKYVDDDDLFWIYTTNSGANHYHYKFQLIDPISGQVIAKHTCPSIQMVNQTEPFLPLGVGAKEHAPMSGMPILNCYPREFLYNLQCDDKRLMVTVAHDPTSAKMVTLVTLWVPQCYYMDMISVSNMPRLIIGVEWHVNQYGYGRSNFEKIHIFNTYKRLNTTYTLNFKESDRATMITCARVDVKTGDIILGCRIVKNPVIWRLVHPGQQMVKIVQVTPPISGDNVTVFVADNFFGSVYQNPHNRMHTWSYDGVPLSSDVNTCICHHCQLCDPVFVPDCRDSMIIGDTIYYVRYSGDWRSFWCKYNPLDTLPNPNPYGPIRTDLPETFPSHVFIAGRFIIEHYRAHNILVTTHIHTLHSRTLQLSAT
jgi:hypothetical protein